MRKLLTAAPELAAHVKAVVDQGRDIQEETVEFTRTRRKKSRAHRKSVPYSYEQALQVALKALEAYFIEQPLFVDSCMDNMDKAAIGLQKNPRYLWGYGPA